MPVWHARTKQWREQGLLAVVGITQEQHAERCRLFAQWHDIEWPILWDAFNTTGAKVVPRFTLLDEQGRVESLKPDPDALDAAFAARPLVEDDLPPTAELPSTLIASESAKGPETAYFGALATLLWGAPAVPDEAVETLTAYAAAHPADAPAQFRVGVAHRLRYDAANARPADFQLAVDHWTRALALDPDQYIWRRRIQQYGPRLDKPYPFYTWVDEAQAAISARGATPIPLRVALTQAEMTTSDAAADAASGGAPDQTGHPDSGGAITRDTDDWLATRTAVAFHTSADRATGRVHVEFTPRAGVSWLNDGEAVTVWIGGDELPAGVTLAGAQRRLFVQQPPTEHSSETRRVEFEVTLGATAGAAVDLPAFALFNACDDASGECRYLRHEFVVRLVRPSSTR